ncbi:hypothetical protein [Flavobacterium sp.]|uniref:hypothetical protein n=1 Tax=Flavobacterium sp. TaxID=239 RepID=UPI003B9A8944
MKKAYYYLFYKLYKFSEAAPSRWLSDWKASLATDLLILFVFSSIINYYKIFLNPTSHIGEGSLMFVTIAIISVWNYFIFHHEDKWKDIVRDFDHLPKRKNRIGSWVVFSVVLIIVSNFLLSFYLYYQL